jgi:sugar (pentulose or hexulose) kinase
MDRQGVSRGPKRRAWKRFAPDQTDRASYDRRYAIYMELYPRLRDLFRH